MANLMSTGYGGGSVTTSAQGNPYTLPGKNDFFDQMISRRYVKEKPKVVRERSYADTSAPEIRERPANQKPAYMEELERLKAFDQYEATLRSAATRPVGLGAQMIPGMAVDERLLPSRLRAQSAVGGQLFQDAPDSKAAPSPSFASGVGSLGGQYNSGAGADTGLNYLPPAERARWAKLLGGA